MKLIKRELCTVVVNWMERLFPRQIKKTLESLSRSLLVLKMLQSKRLERNKILLNQFARSDSKRDRRMSIISIIMSWMFTFDVSRLTSVSLSIHTSCPFELSLNELDATFCGFSSCFYWNLRLWIEWNVKCNAIHKTHDGLSTWILFFITTFLRHRSVMESPQVERTGRCLFARNKKIFFNRNLRSPDGHDGFVWKCQKILQLFRKEAKQLLDSMKHT